MMGFLWQPIKKKVTGVYAGISWRAIRWRLLFIAKLHLIRLGKTTFIGITGSAGKTTTKDLIAGILSGFSTCSSTRLSYGGVDGIAETIRNTPPGQEYCIIEMHGGEPNEMSWALRFIRPVVGVVTVIAREHYSAFDNLEEIADEKSKLISSLHPSGTAVLNIDDPLIRRMGEKAKAQITWVGKHPDATLRLIKATSNFPDPLTLKILFKGETLLVKTNLHGIHLSTSVLSAIGIVSALNLPMKTAITHIKGVYPSVGRMQIVKCDDGVTFIRDDFKAPFWSLQAPLDFLKTAKAERKIAIIGSISDSPKNNSERYIYAAKIARKAADLVVLIGISSINALKERTSPEDNSIQAFINIQQAANFLKTALKKGDLVLLKGTNGTDHLIRLILDRTKDVKCWKEIEECRLGIMCNECPKLYKTEDQSDAENDVQEPETPSPVMHINKETPIIIGLGNPEEKYNNTPHNAGFKLINRLQSLSGSEWHKDRNGEFISTNLKGKPFVLFKPNVYMNDSGKAVNQFLSRNHIGVSQILIVHDDMDLPLGKVRHRAKGSAGGHNGVKSVIYNLGTEIFHRLKIGVQTETAPGANSTSVIALMTKDDLGKLDSAVSEALLLAKEFILAEGKPSANLLNLVEKRRHPDKRQNRIEKTNERKNRNGQKQAH